MNNDNAWLRRTLCIGGILFAVTASARGVSPYLPLNMSPRIERQIERLLILADKVVVRRPIPAAVVSDALPKACAIDAELCAEIREYLSRYMRNAGVTDLSVEVAATSGDSSWIVPNAHGMSVDSPWRISGSAFLQPNDFALLSAGGVAYQGRATPTGTMVSLGFDFAQLDIGFRDHWLSPMADSSALISTEAPTMPSVTLSNYDPIGPLGINYELFVAQMSSSDRIEYEGALVSGKPRLAGMQLGIEPTSGYSFSAARTFQFGGGPRGGNDLPALYHAFMDPTHYDQTDRLGNKLEFGNQMASIASSVVVPGKRPMVFRLEYAAEDTGAESYLIARANLTLGIDFPVLWDRFDLAFEASEWQDSWYVHHVYQDGYRNYGSVIGHWFGDNRLAQDAPWGRSQMLRGGWHLESGDYLQATYRHLDYYFNPSKAAYSPLNELDLSYTTNRWNYPVELKLQLGKDVFGAEYGRLAVALDLIRDRREAGTVYAQASSRDVSGVDLFVDIGVSKQQTSSGWGIDVPPTYYPHERTPHLGLGARRRLGAHSDVGMRIELDRALGSSMLSVRALDYRYRINRRIAVNAFFGVSRYEEQLPMYGFYLGGGLELMDVLPRWDMGIGRRRSDKMMRAKVLPSDVKPDINPNSYYDIFGTVVYLSHRF